MPHFMRAGTQTSYLAADTYTHHVITADASGRRARPRKAGGNEKHFTI